MRRGGRTEGRDEGGRKWEKWRRMGKKRIREEDEMQNGKEERGREGKGREEGKETERKMRREAEKSRRREKKGEKMRGRRRGSGGQTTSVQSRPCSPNTSIHLSLMR